MCSVHAPSQHTLMWVSGKKTMAVPKRTLGEERLVGPEVAGCATRGEANMASWTAVM